MVGWTDDVINSSGISARAKASKLPRWRFAGAQGDRGSGASTKGCMRAVVRRRRRQPPQESQRRPSCRLACRTSICLSTQQPGAPHQSVEPSASPWRRKLSVDEVLFQVRPHVWSAESQLEPQSATGGLSRCRSPSAQCWSTFSLTTTVGDAGGNSLGKSAVYLRWSTAGVLIFAPRLMKCTSMEDAQGSWHSHHGMAGACPWRQLEWPSTEIPYRLPEIAVHWHGGENWAGKSS